MAKKIRLIDEEATSEAVEGATEATSGNVAFSAEDVERLMKYAEQIDWKLWELLKIARTMSGSN